MSDTEYLERRNFFRVKDQGVVHCEPISAQDMQTGMERLKSKTLELPDVSRLFLSLETSLQEHLSHITDPHSKEIMNLLNRKINLLANSALQNDPMSSIMHKSPQPLTLSASGVGFFSAKPWEIGQHCTVELLLMPNKTYLFGYGKISHCQQEQTNQQGLSYRVGVSFECMREEDMERLIQHIMRVEARLIRDSRHPS